MREIWKDIIGYEGAYQISNYGRVRSCDRYIVQNGRWGRYRLSIQGKIDRTFSCLEDALSIKEVVLSG